MLAVKTLQKTKGLILVADDDPNIQSLLRHILESAGYALETASDGLKAVEKARALLPDLILMDVQMPDMDGFEAVKLLRDDLRTARIPIIFLTAKAISSADVIRGLDVGADDYVKKPFNRGELIARVRNLVRQRRLEEELQRRKGELEALVTIGVQLNEALALDELAHKILDATLQQLRADGAVLALVDSAGKPTLLHSHGTSVPIERLITPRSLPGFALAKSEAILVQNSAHDDRVDSIFDQTAYQAGIATPLIHHGLALGVLALAANDYEWYSSDDLRMLRSIGEQAALALRNAQLYTELHRYVANLESMVEARTEALNTAQAGLARAERLAALGTLAAGVAHEVNNPLQPIFTNLELVLEDLDDNRPVDREMLEHAKQEVERIQRVVSRLLDFARPAQPGVSALDANKILREVLALADRQLNHARIKVVTDFQAAANIRGSADQLKQVFLNLVVNAMEAMPDGGTLAIRTAEHDKEFILTVRDTGAGIPANQLSQIFDPFFTTKAEGTGLGLSVSYGIIESHGGKIEVRSAPGNYTEFVIRLPLMTH